MKFNNFRLVISIGFLFSSCQGENIYRDYKDLNAAITAGEFSRGWLPPSLPESSSNIMIYNNVDTNTGGGTFDFNPSEVPAFIEKIKTRFAIQKSDGENPQLVNFEYQKSHWYLSLPKDGKNATWTMNLSP